MNARHLSFSTPGFVARLAGFFLATASLGSLTAAESSEPARELVLLGGMNNIRHHNEQPFGAMQLRFAHSYYGLQPYFNAGVAGHGSHYAGLGACHSFDLPRTFKLTIGTGPGWYRHEANDPDLGYAIEFSSWAELSMEIAGRRIGVSIAHLSNAHLGNTNPGTEAIGVNIHWKQW
jgi:hypothetical protein